jgi:hypothetical protein
VQIFVDDSMVEPALDRDGTVEDAVRHVQADLCPPGRMVVGLRCDGQDVRSGAMIETLQKPASDFECLEVFTETKGDLIAEAMGQADLSLTQTAGDCERVAELLMEGKTKDGIATLRGCVGAWQQIHEAVAKSIEMLELQAEDVEINGQELVDMISQPKDTLFQIKEALQQEDHVLLADILQYELSAVTEQWHAIVNDLRRRALSLSAKTE